MYSNCSLEELSVKIIASRGIVREYCVEHSRNVTGFVLTLRMCVDGRGILILSVRYSDLLRHVTQCLASDSQVRIATLYGLDGLGIKSPVGVRFSPLV